MASFPSALAFASSLNAVCRLAGAELDRPEFGYAQQRAGARVFALPVPVPVPGGGGLVMAEERRRVVCSAVGADSVPEPIITRDDVYKVPVEWQDWEKKRKEEEVARSQGITIRRRPSTGPPKHYVGPFEFRMESEGNKPRNVLEEIIWHKDVEVTQLRERMPLATLRKALAAAGPTRDFIGALRKRAADTGVPALIAEVKKASPSRGVIQPDFDPVRIAKAYEQGGAACLSVLTDSKFFQGSFENLKLIRDAGVEIPLLCKEFVIDAWQLYYARSKGADAALLIAAVLPDQDLRYLTKILNVLGMAALVEVHSVQEFDRVLNIPEIKLIGINNRNLEDFTVDLTNTLRLLEGERGQIVKDRGILVVGESGLFTPDDIAVVQNAGVGAVLVGESLVKQNDPAAGIAGLFGKDISRDN